MFFDSFSIVILDFFQMPQVESSASYLQLRTYLIKAGYFQPLVPNASELVMTLFRDLLATKQHLKLCKEKQSYHSSSKKNEDVSGNTNKSNKILENN